MVQLKNHFILKYDTAEFLFGLFPSPWCHVWNVFFIIPAFPNFSQCFISHSWVFFSFSVCVPLRLLILFLLHPEIPLIPLPSLPSLWLAGHRPYGLEEDVRQYEQDLAKRLYQARVRASQGAAPQPHASSSSAASQLRSAPRPWPLGPDTQHHGGVLGCFGFIWGDMLLLSSDPERFRQHLQQH